MNPRNQSNRRNRKQRNRANRTPRVTPKDVVNGRYFQPPNTIRDSALRPWNNYMCVFSVAHAATTILTIANIAEKVITNNGLFVTSEYKLKIEMKITSMEVYGVTNQTLTVVFFNQQDSNQAYEQATQNIPAKNQYARVGYTWPLADQSCVHTSTSSNRVFSIIGTGADTDSSLCRIRLLWRSVIDGPLKESIPRPRDTMSELAKSIGELCETLRLQSVRSTSSSFDNLSSGQC
jgi:hypothetical protein